MLLIFRKRWLFLNDVDIQGFYSPSKHMIFHIYLFKMDERTVPANMCFIDNFGFTFYEKENFSRI